MFELPPVAQLSTQSKSSQLFACVYTLDNKRHIIHTQSIYCWFSIFSLQHSKVTESWFGLSTDTG
jgi:hypothetical protein